MVFNTQRLFILILCIGLVAVQPDIVSGSRSIELALKWSKTYQGIMPMNHRILKDVGKEGLNAEKKPETVTKGFDPNQSSKRPVRRGSDPIHNRS